MVNAYLIQGHGTVVTIGYKHGVKFGHTTVLLQKKLTDAVN